MVYLVMALYSGTVCNRLKDVISLLSEGRIYKSYSNVSYDQIGLRDDF